jgi:sec-independent protein translocase protein TatA
MGIPSGMELFVIVAVVVLLFGGKKIPELASGLGKGIKNFKSAVKDDEPTTTTAEATTNNAKIEEDKATTTASSTTEDTTTQNKTV